MYTIKEAKNEKLLKKFIAFEYKLYKDDDNYVPPLKKNMLNSMQGHDNPLFMSGEHKFFLLFKNGNLSGRILVGIDGRLNSAKDKKEGYFALFECIQDKEAAFALLNKAEKYLKQKGMESITGPVSPTNNDERKGLLVKGFNGTPVFLNSYNPKYYIDFLTSYGFQKDRDMYAYFFDASDVPIERFRKVVEYAMKKYSFKIDKFDFNKLNNEIKDLKTVLDNSMPETWQHLTPPTYEELKATVNSLRDIADEDILFIARNLENNPIGVVIAVPDFNQVLKKLNGKLGLLGIIKTLYYKRKIDGMRVFAQFVIPQYRNKAVNSAIFYKLMITAREKGYKWGEGSTIAEMNTQSIRSVENAGGKRYRTYRIYRKNI